MHYIKRLLGFCGIFILISYFGLPLMGAPISFGQTVSGSITVGEEDTYTFSAIAGNKVLIRMSRASGNLCPYIRLFDPAGTEIGNSWGGANADVISNSLSSTGTYTIIAADYFGTYSGGYNLTLERLTPGTGAAISFGQTRSGNLVIGDLDSYFFSAAAGNKVIIRMSTASGNLCPYIRLFDPAGTEIGNSWGSANAEIISNSLPSTGTYTIIAADYFGTYSGDYNLTLDRSGPRPILELTQLVDKYFVWHGAELTYTTTYRNTGDADASNVVIEITLPSTLELINGSISSGGSYNSANRRISWNVGSLQAGAEAQTVTFKARVASGIADGTKIVITAQISSAEKPEPTMASVTTTVALPKITSVSPNKGGNAGSVRVTINGQYLDSHAAVKLSKTGQTDIIASNVTGSSQGTQLEATLDLTGKTPGTWDVTVTNPGGGSNTLSNAFTIESGGEQKLWVEIIGRDQIRVGRPTEYLYRYGNAGNVDIEMGLLDLKLPEGFECVKVMDSSKNVIWDQKTDTDTPLYFVTAPLGPGEVRELRVTLLASTIASQISTKIDKPKVLPPILIFFGKSLIASAVENFAKTFIKHKWDEYGPPGEDNIYELDWIAAFKSAWKNFISLEGATDFTCKYWFSNMKTLMIKWLESKGKNLAAYYLNNFWITIFDIPGWVGVIKENLAKDPNFKQTPTIKKQVNPVISWDPNDKSGPTGCDPTGTSPQSQKRFILLGDHSFPYMIQFENLENATAAVQDMKISDQLDANLDWSTFSFDTIQIGTHTITVPQGSKSFSTSVDFRPEMTVIVEVECTFNSSTGRVQWIFCGKHPSTGELADFLPPNKENVDPKGRGWVLYNIKPKANLSSGTVIKNKATIDFEIDVPPAPMDTPEWINTIDKTKPESHVLALSPTQNSPVFTVQWQGTDKHSGIQSYTINVSDNGGSYVEWLSNTTETSATFSGAPGHTYAFYSIAKDNSGNLENAPAAPDTTTTVTGSSEVIIKMNRTALYFGAASGSVVTQPQNVLISSSSGGILNWTAAPNQNWLRVSPASGTGDSIITVSVDASGLSPGTYNGSITITDPNATNSPQTVSVILNVYKSGRTSQPFGVFATPVHGSTVRSSIPVTGWVLDDIGVESVRIYRKEGKSLVYIGDAVFVEGARPDVEQAYPDYPLNYRAGWGYMMLTNFLPNGGNGTFNIHAIAADTEGHEVTLGIKTISCDNTNAVKPFGAIDTPTQGGTASGSNFINWGWVLTPQPNSIPTDGSTIKVWINGINLGHPTYNIYREDIATLFPGYANSNGAAGYFYIDTASYENGVHTIQWTATDDAGNTDGIGSRYFTIQNTGGSAERKAQSAERKTAAFNVQCSMLIVNPSQVPLDYSSPIRVKKGYNQNIKPHKRFPGKNGNITIEIKELERIEIHLFEGTRGLAPLPDATLSNLHRPPTNNFRGFQLVGDQVRPLPIGSFLDVERGIFCWQPGPGFLGRYSLVFLESGPNGVMTKKNIFVEIVP
ncbi:pre-peptidase C-terminal domain-containing protein [Acidobacteriota bacterium]